MVFWKATKSRIFSWIWHFHTQCSAEKPWKPWQKSKRMSWTSKIAWNYTEKQADFEFFRQIKGVKLFWVSLKKSQVITISLKNGDLKCKQTLFADFNRQNGRTFSSLKLLITEILADFQQRQNSYHLYCWYYIGKGRSSADANISTTLK